MAKGKMHNHHGQTHRDDKMGGKLWKPSSAQNAILKKRANAKRRRRDKETNGY